MDTFGSPSTPHGAYVYKYDSLWFREVVGVIDRHILGMPREQIEDEIHELLVNLDSHYRFRLSHPAPHNPTPSLPAHIMPIITRPHSAPPTPTPTTSSFLSDSTLPLLRPIPRIPISSLLAPIQPTTTRTSSLPSIHQILEIPLPPGPTLHERRVASASRVPCINPAPTEAQQPVTPQRRLHPWVPTTLAPTPIIPPSTPAPLPLATTQQKTTLSPYPKVAAEPSPPQWKKGKTFSPTNNTRSTPPDISKDTKPASSPWFPLATPTLQPLSDSEIWDYPTPPPQFTHSVHPTGTPNWVLDRRAGLDFDSRKLNRDLVVGLPMEEAGEGFLTFGGVVRDDEVPSWAKSGMGGADNKAEKVVLEESAWSTLGAAPQEDGYRVAVTVDTSALNGTTTQPHPQTRPRPRSLRNSTSTSTPTVAVTLTTVPEESETEVAENEEVAQELTTRDSEAGPSSAKSEKSRGSPYSREGRRRHSAAS